jgi:hypothetical protein
MEKSMDSVHASWTTASGWSTVDPQEAAEERSGWRSILLVLTDSGWEGEGWYWGLPWGSPELGERRSGRATRMKWWQRWSSMEVSSSVGEEERGMVSGAGCFGAEVPLLYGPGEGAGRR